MEAYPESFSRISATRREIVAGDSRSLVEQSVLDGFEPHFVVIKGLHGDTLETLAQQFGFEVYRY